MKTAIKNNATILIIKIGPEKPSKFKGTYRRCIVKDITPDSSRLTKDFIFDVTDQIPNSSKWIGYLKEQAMFNNINVIKVNETICVDSNSNFNYLGIKGEKELA